MHGIVIKSIFLMMTMKDVSSNLWKVISFFLWDMVVILSSMGLVLIDANNINVFREKVFFCFSCNSNKNNSKSLARLSKTYGIEAFVGFGNIPTDYIEGVPFSKRCIAIYKGKIVKIMKYALYYAVENNENVDNLVRIIKILTCKEIQSLRQQKRFHGRDAVIEQLYKFKDEIKIYGDVYAKL